MEAVALHDFKAVDEDELSFEKGQVLKVLKMEDSNHWYTAELDGKEGLVPSNHIQMKNHDWYFAHTTRFEAEEILIDEHEGAFLIRISTNTPRNFSLSVKFPDSVEHFKVLRHPKGQLSLGRTKFRSLNEMLDHHREVSVSRTHDVTLKDMEYEEDEEEEEVEEYLVQAKYDFEPQEEGELEFRRGDVIRVLDRYDENWWEGEVMGKKGCFPVNYVGPCVNRVYPYYNQQYIDVATDHESEPTD